jgi:hypothetical protein
MSEEKPDRTMVVAISVMAILEAIGIVTFIIYKLYYRA